MKKTSTLLIIGMIAVIFTGLYTGYVFLQKSSVSADSKVLDKQVTDFEAQKLKLENQEVLAAINAKRALNDFDQEVVKWSHVINRIRATVPLVKKNALVEIVSYSGSGNNPLSINMKTRAGSRDPYFDVADLIEAFDESDEFIDNFVGSISSGVDDDGNEILSFILSTTFVDGGDIDVSGIDLSNSEDDLGGEISDILNESLDFDVENSSKVENTAETSDSSNTSDSEDVSAVVDSEESPISR